MTRGRERPALLAALLAAAVLAIAAAVVANTAHAAQGGAVPSQLRFGYQQIPNGELIVKDKKWLEQALPHTKIKWIEFDSGADVNTAALAGSIDFGLAGSSPVAKGIALGIKYQVPWIFDVIGSAESLVAKSSSGVTSLQGLVGKTVGTPFGSTSHFSLLAALKDAGVSPSSVKIVDLEPPDILAAWQRGDIDAAYVWDPTLSQLKQDGKVLITSAQLAQKGQVTADLGVVSSSFAQKYPAAVQTVIAQESRAVDYYRSNPQGAAASIARQLNITPAEALAQTKGLIFLNAKQQAGAKYLGTPLAPGAFAANLQSAATFLKGQGLVDKVPAVKLYRTALANSFVASLAGK
jgi:taurine transport system substrate-binding protein